MERPNAAHVGTIALIGSPVVHSLSPDIHNAVYERLSLNLRYTAIDIPDKSGLPEIAASARNGGYRGLAVTKPYKEEIMAFLDETDASCAESGACNTVLVSDGRLIGFNTDGYGLLRALVSETGIVIAETVFLIIGAGGTAKPVCYELIKHNARHIYIMSRSDSCCRLARLINRRKPFACEAVSMTGVGAAVKKADVILNLSGAGMFPNLDETPIEKAFLEKRHICFDATYRNPEKTRFLRDAEDIGAKVVNGLGMLIYQGARQIGVWAGINEPVEEMFSAANSVLQHKRGRL